MQEKIPITSLPEDVLIKFRQNPVLFTEMCGWKTWSIQREIMNSVRDHRYTAVVSCPDSGKTWVASRIAAWYLNSFPKSIVVVIAPLARQIKDLFWKEFRTTYADSRIILAGTPKLDAHMQITADHFIRGYIAREESGKSSIMDKMTGYHAPHMLVIMDQADGLQREVWDAVWGLMTSGHARLLTLTNPINPESENAQVIMPDRKTSYGRKYVTDNGEVKPVDGIGWNVIKIRAEDTPNVANKILETDPSAFPGLMSYEYYVECREVWDPNDPRTKIYLDAEYADSLSLTVLTKSMRDRIFRVQLEPDFTRIKVGVDVADEGLDRSVWTVMAGNRLLFIDSVVGHNTEEVATHTEYIRSKIYRLTGHDAIEWNIDAVGIGKGVHDKLINKGFPANAVYAGEGVDDIYTRKQLFNKRAEMHWRIRELAESNSLSLVPFFPLEDENELSRLQEDCAKVRYKLPEGTFKIQILSKKDLRKFLKRSPDNFDSLCLACSNHNDLPVLDIPRIEIPTEAEVLGDAAFEQRDITNMSFAEIDRIYFKD